MGIIRKELFNEEEIKNVRIRYELLIAKFNEIHDKVPDEIDEMSYMDFHKMSREQLRPEEWLEFLSDYRVSQVLDKIMLLKMRSNVNKLINSEDKSVAGSQKLTAALNFMNKHFESVMGRDSTVYVYTSVPLTKSEELSRNAKTLVIRPNINPHNPSNPGSKNFNSKVKEN